MKLLKTGLTFAATFVLFLLALAAFFVSPMSGAVRYAIGGTALMQAGEPIVQTCATAANTTVNFGSGIRPAVACFDNEGSGNVRLGTTTNLTTSAYGFLLRPGEDKCRPAAVSTWRCRGVAADQTVSVTPYN